MQTEMKISNAAANEAVGRDLQDTLVDLIDLSLQAKQAHYNVQGAHFKAVHEHLEEIYTALEGWVDEVAERAVAIDVPPDGRLGTVADSTRLETFPAGRIQDTDAVTLVAQRVSQVAGMIGERVGRVGESDPLSQDLLIDIARGLEKQRWMLRSQLT